MSPFIIQKFGYLGIKGISDLINQDEVEYGIVENSTEYFYMVRQKREPFISLLEEMEAKNNLLSRASEDYAIQRVRNAYG